MIDFGFDLIFFLLHQRSIKNIYHFYFSSLGCRVVFLCFSEKINKSAKSKTENGNGTENN